MIRIENLDAISANTIVKIAIDDLTLPVAKLNFNVEIELINDDVIYK